MDQVKNLQQEEAIKKLQSLITDTRVGMFFTKGSGVHESVRPMSVAEVDDDGSIWFLADRRSEKVNNIQDEPGVHLVFSHPGKEIYLDLYGEADINTQQSTLERLWTPIAKAWFPEGKDDPALCAIQVKLKEGFYWDTRHGKLVDFLGIISSAITGKQLGDGVIGELKIN